MHFLVHDHIPQSLDSLSNHDQLKCPGRVRTMQGEGTQESVPVACCFAVMVEPYRPDQPAAGPTVERRKAHRNRIQVEIEIAHPGFLRCRGYAENISRTGVSLTLWEGEVPRHQRSVILNFRVWTGNETLYRKIYARVIRFEQATVALEFAEHDFVAEAIVQDLLFYQRRERRRLTRRPEPPAPTTTTS